METLSENFNLVVEMKSLSEVPAHRLKKIMKKFPAGSKVSNLVMFIEPETNAVIINKDCTYINGFYDIIKEYVLMGDDERWEFLKNLSDVPHYDKVIQVFKLLDRAIERQEQEQIRHEAAETIKYLYQQRYGIWSAKSQILNEIYHLREAERGTIEDWEKAYLPYVLGYIEGKRAERRRRKKHGTVTV